MDDAAATEAIGIARIPVTTTEELHRAEYRSLLRFLLYQGAELAEAQDAVQEAFSVLCRPNVLAAVSSPRAWLRTVAYRCWLRQDVRVPVDPVPDLLEQQALSQKDWHTPLAAVELREEHVRVATMLRALSPKQREAMAWHIDGFSTPEIAEAMGIEPSAVRQNLSRARAALKIQLGLDPSAADEEEE
jgi:RNA polymerase sigma-70 factor (ECF subfamily)